jgi:undecaprenyl-diphosphatase
MFFLQMTGLESEPALLRLCVRLFSVFGVLLACHNTLMRLRREQKLAMIPARRRRRQPDAALLLMQKLIRSATIPLVLGLLLTVRFSGLNSVLWLHGCILILNGIFLYLPQFMLRGNKDARSMSGLDALLIGFSGALSVLPGFSRMATTVSCARMRGADKQFAVELGLFLCIPALLCLCLIDFFSLISAKDSPELLICTFASVSAFCGSFLGAHIIRYFGRRPGFTAFAYYSWGAALLAFILFLTII